MAGEAGVKFEALRSLSIHGADGYVAFFARSGISVTAAAAEPGLPSAQERLGPCRRDNPNPRAHLRD
jgi:hypothetical protein